MQGNLRPPSVPFIPVVIEELTTTQELDVAMAVSVPVVQFYATVVFRKGTKQNVTSDWFRGLFTLVTAHTWERLALRLQEAAVFFRAAAPP